MKNILIIEDDPKIAAALEIRFRSGGYGTETAGDAIAGLNKAVNHQPDLIVLDIFLPGGNGLDLARQFKSIPATRGAPIIFVTASKAPDLRQRAMDLGAAGLFEKPYDATELLAVAGHALGETGMFKRPIARFDPGADRLAPAPSPSPRSLKRVLIIEDNRRTALALALRLQAAGYEATIAQDVLTGVNLAAESRPDLILLDISMPAGDGFVVAARVRDLLSRATPVLFLAGEAQAGDRERATALGARGYFERPFDMDGILAAIAREIPA